MSRTSSTLLRLGVPSLAAATLVAGIPAFLGTAQAAPIASITITPVDGSDTAAAGSCQAYEVRAAPLTPGTTTEGEKVNVVLTNLAGSGTADASFCTLPTRVSANTVRTPAAGTVVSTQGATGNTTSNSVDQSSFVLGRGAAGSETTGRVFIGVTRNDFSAPGTVRVEAYGDTNGNNTFDVAAGEVQAQPRTVTFTSGGTTGSNPNQNAATVVEALTGTDAATGTANTDTETAVQNEQRAFRVFVNNATGDVLNGVTVNVTVSTPNAQTTRVFGTTDNNGIASGTITFPNVDVAANSVVTFFVNQSDNGTVTTGLDSGEPSDTVAVSVSQAPTARTIVLSALADTATTQATPAYQLNPAINPTTDGDRTFRAVVDNGAGATGSTVGTPVLFTVTGGSGDETVSPLNDVTVDNTATTANTADSIVDFVVNDPTPDETAPLTVTALVRGQGTTATTTFTFAAAVDEARNLDLTPETATSNVGAATPFTAKVIDEDGNPVVGVPVTFTETGPGAFRNGNSTIVVFTNREGNAIAEVIAAIGEQGTQTITATQPATAETAKAAGNPFGVRAGNRSDTSTNTVTGVQATASPTTSATAGPTASATPTSGTTATPTPSGSVSPPAGTVCVNPAGISLSRAFITPGIPVTVTVTAPAGAEVELQAYSRPSTTYNQVRRSVVGQTGQISFDVTPGTNTRIFAACVGQTNSASTSQVINVRTALSLTVVRNGTRNYTFQGRILPRRAGQLITLYRVTNDGTRVLTSQLKTDSTGTYRVNRRFTGSGTFGFLTRTGQTLTNAAGESNTPQTVAGVNAGRGVARPTAIF